MLWLSLLAIKWRLRLPLGEGPEPGGVLTKEILWINVTTMLVTSAFRRMRLLPGIQPRCPSHYWSGFARSWQRQNITV